jgi:hypothetical protein
MDSQKKKGNISWKQGWTTDSQTQKQLPRWSLSQSGRYRSISAIPVVNSPLFNLTSGGGFRSTYIQHHILKQRNPGPGRYRTDFQFPTSSSDSLNVNLTVNESSPNFSLSRLPKETSLSKTKLSILKPSFLNVPVARSTDLKPTPGPGHYTQYTFFGAASGPSRKPYF